MINNKTDIGNGQTSTAVQFEAHTGQTITAETPQGLRTEQLQQDFFAEADGHQDLANLPQNIEEWITKDFEQAKITAERLKSAQQTQFIVEKEATGKQLAALQEDIETRETATTDLSKAQAELDNATTRKQQLAQQISENGLIASIKPDTSDIPKLKTDLRAIREGLRRKVINYGDLNATAINARREQFTTAIAQGLEADGIIIDEPTVESVKTKINQIAKHVEAKLNDYPDAYDHHNLPDLNEVVDAQHPLTEHAKLILKAQLIAEDVFVKGVNSNFDDKNHLYPTFEDPLIPEVTIGTSTAEQRAQTEVNNQTELLEVTEAEITAKINSADLPEEGELPPEQKLLTLFNEQLSWTEDELKNLQLEDPTQTAYQTLLQKYPELEGVDILDPAALKTATEDISRIRIKANLTEKANQLSRPSRIEEIKKLSNHRAMAYEGLDTVSQFLDEQITPENIAHLEEILAKAEISIDDIDTAPTSEGMIRFNQTMIIISKQSPEVFDSRAMLDIKRIAFIIANDNELETDEANRAIQTSLALFTESLLKYYNSTNVLANGTPKNTAMDIKADLVAARQQFDIRINDLGRNSSAYSSRTS